LTTTCCTQPTSARSPDRASVGRHRGPSRASDSTEDGAPGGGLSLDRLRSRLHDNDRDACRGCGGDPAFHAALDRAELPTSRFHDLRHAAATFALSQGFTLEDVKQLLGHSSIVLTSNTYGHVLEQRQRQVARGMDAVLGVVPGG
jgi:hypothetical protein